MTPITTKGESSKTGTSGDVISAEDRFRDMAETSAAGAAAATERSTVPTDQQVQASAPQPNHAARANQFNQADKAWRGRPINLKATAAVFNKAHGFSAKGALIRKIGKPFKPLDHMNRNLVVDLQLANGISPEKIEKRDFTNEQSGGFNPIPPGALNIINYGGASWTNALGAYGPAVASVIIANIGILGLAFFQPKMVKMGQQLRDKNAHQIGLGKAITNKYVYKPAQATKMRKELRDYAAARDHFESTLESAVPAHIMRPSDTSEPLLPRKDGKVDFLKLVMTPDLLAELDAHIAAMPADNAHRVALTKATTDLITADLAMETEVAKTRQGANASHRQAVSHRQQAFTRGTRATAVSLASDSGYAGEKLSGHETNKVLSAGAQTGVAVLYTLAAIAFSMRDEVAKQLHQDMEVLDSGLKDYLTPSGLAKLDKINLLKEPLDENDIDISKLEKMYSNDTDFYQKEALKEIDKQLAAPGITVEETEDLNRQKTNIESTGQADRFLATETKDGFGLHQDDILSKMLASNSRHPIHQLLNPNAREYSFLRKAIETPTELTEFTNQAIGIAGRSYLGFPLPAGSAMQSFFGRFLVGSGKLNFYTKKAVQAGGGAAGVLGALEYAPSGIDPKNQEREDVKAGEGSLSRQFMRSIFSLYDNPARKVVGVTHDIFGAERPDWAYTMSETVQRAHDAIVSDAALVAFADRFSRGSAMPVREDEHGEDEAETGAPVTTSGVEQYQPEETDIHSIATTSTPYPPPPGLTATTGETPATSVAGTVEHPDLDNIPVDSPDFPHLSMEEMERADAELHELAFPSVPTTELPAKAPPTQDSLLDRFNALRIQDMLESAPNTEGLMDLDTLALARRFEQLGESHEVSLERAARIMDPQES